MGLFSYQDDGETIRLNLLGVRIKLVRDLRLEAKNGGPYGLHDIVKLHAGLPFCPASVHVQHGWYPDADVPFTDLHSSSSLMLCWNKRFKQNWERKSRTPCLIMGAPFVQYRRAAGIEQAPDARGTIAYPAHAMRQIKPAFDLDQYCAELEALPERFHPITVSLHPLDISVFNLDKAYHARGFRTVCAGLDHARPFCEVFYDNLRKYRYATSNEPGSYTFFAVEMGIPFFVLGPLATLDNRDGISPDFPHEEISIKRFEFGRIAYDLFAGGVRGEISPEQRDYVLSEVGEPDWATPEELRRAIYAVASKRRPGGGPLRLYASMFGKMLRHPFLAGYIARYYAFIRQARREILQR